MDPFPPVNASVPFYVRAYASLPAVPKWKPGATGSYFTSEHYSSLPELPELPDVEDVRARTGASLTSAWGATVSAAYAFVAVVKRVSNRGTPPQEEGFVELEYADATPPASTPQRKYANAAFDSGE